MIKVLTGSNHFALALRLKQLVKDFSDAYGELNIERYDGEDVELGTVLGAMSGGSLFASNKLIILKNATQNKQLVEGIDKILESDNEDTEVIFVEGKIDKRSVFYKTVKAKKMVEEFEQLDEIQLTNWLVETAHKEGSELKQKDARLLLDRVGANQDLLWNELQKLMIHGDIDQELIENLTEATPKSTIFELLDAAFSGNKQRTVSIYADLRAQRIEPEAILPLVSWQLHVLALLASTSKPLDEIGRESSMSPFTLRKNQPLARKIGLAKIKEVVRKSTLLDADFKSRAIDKEEALLELLLSV